MKNGGFKYKRKRMIVFSYEGKNNKTESIYFSNYQPSNESFILRMFSSGVNDPIKMIQSTKSKRKEYDYNAKEDLTFIFMDGDDDLEKIRLIHQLQKEQPRDIKIILTNPCFELWFLNHFVRTTKSFTNKELLEELSKYIPNYRKNQNYFNLLIDKETTAIANSIFQKTEQKANPNTDVVILFTNKIIKPK